MPTLEKKKQQKGGKGQGQRNRRKEGTRDPVTELHRNKATKAGKKTPMAKPNVPGPGSTADKLLKVTGGQGTDIRNRSTQSNSSMRTQLVVAGQDPTLDIDVGYDDRALQYLAMGTVLRAIRRGWLTSQGSTDQHPYYAFLYLLNAYRTAAKGTIPTMQQAPRYFWEICYALKPKTEKFKTGGIKYNTASIDVLSEGDPEVKYPMGPTEENYHIFWGTTTGGDPAIDGFSILLGPTADYTEALGATSINYLWSTFPNDGLNKLEADPGTSAFLLNDTSAQAAVYPELGSSYGVAAGLATTTYSERFINSPILAKFCAYQEFDFTWRGWHEYRKNAGSPCYIGPRASEMMDVKQFTNKASPIFLMYNFDEFVEVGALILARILEVGALSEISINDYPLTSLQFQIMLRQCILPYFDNDMAQDLRYSALLTDEKLVTMIPLVVGPNGNSVTSSGEGLFMPPSLSKVYAVVVD